MFHGFMYVYQRVWSHFPLDFIHGPRPTADQPVVPGHHQRRFAHGLVAHQDHLAVRHGGTQKWLVDPWKSRENPMNIGKIP